VDDDENRQIPKMRTGSSETLVHGSFQVRNRLGFLLEEDRVISDSLTFEGPELGCEERSIPGFKTEQVFPLSIVFLSRFGIPGDQSQESANGGGVS